MNFTTRLNRILKASGIKVEATWCKAVQSYSVWCEYHNGYELRTLWLSGISRRTICSGERTADDKAQDAALTIVDQVLEWESR